MFGKIFATTFTGSMVGSGAMVFAVWGYVIANVSDSIIELNPNLLAGIIGKCTPAEVKGAIAILTAPDPESRCKDYDGARLVHLEAFRYFVVTAEHYRGLRNATDRQEYMRNYMRDYMRKQRSGVKQLDTGLNTVKRGLAHTESESDTESEEALSSSLRSDSSSGDDVDLKADQEKPELKLVPDAPPADHKAALKERLREVTREACESYNSILAKPHGLLPAVRMSVGEDRRMKEVKRCIKVAREISRDVFKRERLTREFWDAYFQQCAEDQHKSGRLGGGKGHENWRPDFEYLTRESVMLSVFEKAMAA